jgi:hypothetical protein
MLIRTRFAELEVSLTFAYVRLGRRDWCFSRIQGRWFID